MTDKICQLVSIAILLLQLSPAVSFSSSPFSKNSYDAGLGMRSGSATSRRTSPTTTTSFTQRSASSVDGDQTGSSISGIANKEKIAEAMKREFNDTAILFQYELSDHKPLGCTVDETVVPDCNYVFISKLTPGGFASQAGLQVGDVLLATNGMFGGDDVSIIVNSGVDEIKSLIVSIKQDETLYLSIARGTDVMEKHEDFLVELCSLNGPSDKQIEGNIEDLLCQDYYSEETDICDDDDECLIDDMYDMWAEELPPPPSTTEFSEQPKETAEKIKPWSSRSSPSGTFVRDPVTGEMKNIDSTDWSNGMGSN